MQDNRKNTITDIIALVRKHYPGLNTSIIERAYDIALRGHGDQVRKSGRPVIDHPLSVAHILARHRMDAETVSAGLLHDVLEDTSIRADEIEIAFGKDIREMVEGVTKLAHIPVSYELSEVRNLRRLLFAMAKDLRVVIIKLADRLDNLRDLHALDHDSQRRIAQETVDIFIPIASRLGLGRMRFEMEDLALRYLKPDDYFKIAEKLATKREERERETHQIVREVRALLTRNGMKVAVHGRPKHIASIYRKMQEGKTFEEMHDLVGIRVITRSISDCYQALGIIHTKYKPIPGRFKDFIALPKQNGYQSLHTTVVDDKGRRVEIQIRSQRMHRVAEVGASAHWRYKTGEKPILKDKEHLSFLDRVLEWQKDLIEPEQIMEQLRRSLFEDEVFVFTPKGEVKALPVGATPLDFAYAVHTDIGMRASGAKVNGRMVGFDYKLKTGDMVEIMTSPHQKPSRDWLKLVVTSKARTKIRQYFRTVDRDLYIERGRKALVDGMKSMGLSMELTDDTLKKVIDEYDFEDEDELFLAIGEGRLKTGRVMRELFGEVLVEGKAKRRAHSPIMVKLEGSYDIDYRIAGCCIPSPPCEIVGYITSVRGITIHRAGCSSLRGRDKSRIVKAEWVGRGDYEIHRIHITIDDREGILSQISDVFYRNGVNIMEHSGRGGSGGSRARLDFIISLERGVSEGALIDALESIDGVQKVRWF